MKKKKTIFFAKRLLGVDDTQATYRDWNAIGAEAKFSEAWEMVKLAHEIKGGTLDELRLQRSVTNLIRKES